MEKKEEKVDFHCTNRQMTLRQTMQGYRQILTEQQEDPPEPVLTVNVASEVIRELDEEEERWSDTLF